MQIFDSFSWGYTLGAYLKTLFLNTPSNFPLNISKGREKKFVPE
jgi:hypothetical protein